MNPLAQAFLPVLAALALFALVGQAQYIVTQPPPPQHPPGTAPPPAATQELVLFTADGPVRVRLTVTRSGKPAAEPWRTAFDTLFAHCDRDADGSLADKERAIFQTARSQYADFVVVDSGLYASNRASGVSFPEQAGKVDRTLFGEGFLHAGLGPVSFTPVAVRKDSQALSDKLLKTLDADGDGKLSAAELKAARARLAPLDVNEDDVIDSDELTGRTPNSYYQFVAVADFESYAIGSRRPAPPALPDVFTPSLGQPVGVRDLLVRDADKDNALSPAELVCDPKAVAALDADGDGRLDSDELAAWLRQPPDLDLTFDLPAPARRGSWLRPAPKPTPAAVRLAPKGRLADTAKSEGEGAMRAVLPSARVRFTAEGGSAGRGPWQASTGGLRSVFEQLAGTRGEVERKQVAENPEYAASLTLFDFADRDGNGKVTAAELDRVLRTNEGLVDCRAVLEVADLGRGLLELLDRDGDGRLSPRELNAAADHLAALDRDGDGKLSPTEVPRGYAVTAKPASVDVVPTGGYALDVNVVLTGIGGPSRTVMAKPAPEWFRQADRNGDGDVSAREFPGPPAVFRKIDTDGDGLVSPEEAQAFETAAPRPR